MKNKNWRDIHKKHWPISGITNEYCDTETFEPKCEDGEVIMMTSARYGRMKLAR